MSAVPSSSAYTITVILTALFFPSVSASHISFSFLIFSSTSAILSLISVVFMSIPLCRSAYRSRNSLSLAPVVSAPFKVLEYFCNISVCLLQTSRCCSSAFLSRCNSLTASSCFLSESLDFGGW
ncbi:hypothetical protein CPB86DRAFT_622081 [Serendipita vermifera]|nr:hypothetical protein CPB86DRAFT_622081 [Serendipita vermifera]